MKYHKKFVYVETYDALASVIHGVDIDVVRIS